MPRIKDMLQPSQRDRLTALSDRLFEEEVADYDPSQRSASTQQTIELMHQMAEGARVTPNNSRNRIRLDQLRKTLSEMV